jgi:tRNA wybutosine-synthesizing protein 3
MNNSLTILKILHVQTSDLQTAHVILTAALSAGFRESGIMNPGLGTSSFPMVAVRCNGLAIDSIIGVMDWADGRVRYIVDGAYLRTLVKVCNLRFEDNKRRANVFSENIKDVLFKDMKGKNEVSEDKEARKARKREQGLQKQMESKVVQDIKGKIIGDDAGGNISSFLFEPC